MPFVWSIGTIIGPGMYGIRLSMDGILLQMLIPFSYWRLASKAR